ncbi:MAG: cellulose biosynthesis cyclic di-GMP-binding regulatory protein BcsB [Anaerolineae bacterium]
MNESRGSVARLRFLLLAAGFTLLSLLILGSPGATARVSAQAAAEDSGELHAFPGMQVTSTPTATAAINQVTPTPTPTLPAEPSPSATAATTADNAAIDFKITFEDLGFANAAMESPSGGTQYNLRLPDGSQVLEGSYLELDISYSYIALGSRQTQLVPESYGTLTVSIDDDVETETVFVIDRPLLDRQPWRIPLPPKLLNDPEVRQHNISIKFEAGQLCTSPHQATVLVHNTSFFALDLNQSPATVELKDYPYPIFQQAFDTDQVRFVLPEGPSGAELTAAASIAARLGGLTANRLVISATTDVALSATTSREHLIVVGRPDSNAFIPQLYELTDPPLQLAKRQLAISSQGPIGVGNGNTFSYRLTITNTNSRSVTGLSLVDKLPDGIELLGCDPVCEQDVSQNEIRWELPTLRPGSSHNYNITFRLPRSATNPIIDHTATLLNADDEPINVDTLAMNVGANGAGNSGGRSTAEVESDYFFVLNNRGVAESDGVIQELVSPWDETKVIVIATGLTDAALHKAAQALSSQTRFPGMSGAFALVQELQPFQPQAEEAIGTDLTFNDLGYGERLAQGFRGQSLSYFFGLPPSWKLTDDASLRLIFRHSQLIDLGKSSLKVSLNRQPLTGIVLDKGTSLQGDVSLPLPVSALRGSGSNQLTVDVELLPPDDDNPCANEPEDAWLVIDNASRLHLPHEELELTTFDLARFSDPFDRQPSLIDLLIVVPDSPRVHNIENLLNLAAALGNSTRADDYLPTVVHGDAWRSVDLAGFNIIALGRPTQNSFLQEVNNDLPQPFIPGTDQIEQRVNRVILRLPPATDLGYVQILPSPWNETKALLAVTGTSEQALGWAFETLLNRPWRLGGNLSLVQGEEVQFIDTNASTAGDVASLLATAVPEITIVPDSTATPQSTPTGTPPERATSSGQAQTSGQQTLLVVLLIASIVAAIGTGGVGIWLSNRKRQP